jgi:DNA-binding transcriptional LysR family regulator
MDLQQLRTFVIVAEEKSVTKAAKRLFLTPPSVSAHIKTLEAELGIQLFVRTSTGMEITAQGGLLKAKAEQALQAAQEVQQHAAALQEQLCGTVRFGLNATPHLLRVAPIVRQIQTRYPEITIAFEASVSGKILTALREHTLDLGYVFGPIPTDTMKGHCVCVVDLVVAVPKRWEERVPPGNWEALAALPWIMADAYCPFQDLVEQHFAKRGLDYRRVVQASDEATKLELVSTGVGLALLEYNEASAAVGEGKLVVWETEALPCTLSLTYAKEREHEPLIQTVIQEVLQVWRTPGLSMEPRIQETGSAES